LNIYPGLFSIGSWTPGVYAAVGEWDNLILGITFTSIPLGIAYGNH
jgi:hypothetical protein